MKSSKSGSFPKFATKSTLSGTKISHSECFAKTGAKISRKPGFDEEK